VPLDWRASMFSVTTSLRGWADTELAIARISASLGFKRPGLGRAVSSRPWPPKRPLLGRQACCPV